MKPLIKSQHPGFFGAGLGFSPSVRSPSFYSTLTAALRLARSGSLKIRAASIPKTIPTDPVNLKLPRHPIALIKMIEIDEIALPT